jgi:hypothetical protein
MANTYTWTITNMTCLPEVDGYTDVVVQVSWKCIGTDGTHTGEQYDINSFTFDPTNFTPYADLTQEEVLSWVWSTVDQTAIEAVVAAQIANLANPPVVALPLPWVS